MIRVLIAAAVGLGVSIAIGPRFIDFLRRNEFGCSVIEVSGGIASHTSHRTPELDQMASKTRKSINARAKTGNGGETHQNAGGPEHWLTTNQGTPISDNQNSLKSGERDKF